MAKEAFGNLGAWRCQLSCWFETLRHTNGRTWSKVFKIFLISLINLMGLLISRWSHGLSCRNVLTISCKVENNYLTTYYCKTGLSINPHPKLSDSVKNELSPAEKAEREGLQLQRDAIKAEKRLQASPSYYCSRSSHNFDYKHYSWYSARYRSSSSTSPCLMLFKSPQVTEQTCNQPWWLYAL